MPSTSVLLSQCEVHPGQELGQECPLHSGLGDERGDDRLTHRSLDRERSLSGYLVQLCDLVSGLARLEQQFCLVWVRLEVELGGDSAPERLALPT